MTEMTGLFRRPQPPEDGEFNELHVDLRPLTSIERRDLANALLRAAWYAALLETRVLLLDLVVDVDDAVLAGGP